MEASGGPARFAYSGKFCLLRASFAYLSICALPGGHTWSLCGLRRCSWASICAPAPRSPILPHRWGTPPFFPLFSPFSQLLRWVATPLFPTLFCVFSPSVVRLCVLVPLYRHTACPLFLAHIHHSLVHIHHCGSYPPAFLPLSPCRLFPFFCPLVSPLPSWGYKARPFVCFRLLARGLLYYWVVSARFVTRHLAQHGDSIMNRYDGAPVTCEVCGVSASLEYHHVIYLSDGGRDDLTNIEVLCHDHHQGKHTANGDWAEFGRKGGQVTQANLLAKLGPKQYSEYMRSLARMRWDRKPGAQLLQR